GGPRGAEPARAEPEEGGPAQEGSRWGALLGGLALGGLLAWALSGTGLSALLLLALLAVVVVLALRRRNEATAQEQVQFSGVGQERIALPASGGGPAAAAVPAGFDAAGFLRAAKLNFVKL